MWLPVDVQTLFSFLDVFGDVHLTGADGAQTALLDHLTLGISVGDTRGETAAARLRARAP